jgi:hypothetical protein
MYKIILALLLSYFINTAGAQENQACVFQSLFTFEPGMNKMIVLDSINKTYQISIVNHKVSKIPPYKGSGGDSIMKEVVTYNITGSPCFKGHNSRLHLEFADSKLYKVFIITEYIKGDYQDMISNFTSLRNSIKPHWKFEKETRVTGANMHGFGYDYTKVKNASSKTEKVSLQYMDMQTNKNIGSYQLEVTWVNLANTRMESSYY